jgi:hypothetical protein
VTKRAVEIARDEFNKTGKTKLIGTNEVLTAFSELQNSKTVSVMKGLRKFEVIVIIALFLELQSNQVEKILLDKVQERCEQILFHMQNRPVSSLIETQDNDDQSGFK